jgi:hypothetical protein
MIRRPSRRTCRTEPFARGRTPRLGGIPFENRAGYKRMIIQCHRALILGRGAKECHSVMVPGGDAPFLDIMTVQDLRLEIRRDGTATAAIPAELKRRVRAVVQRA